MTHVYIHFQKLSIPFRFPLNDFKGHYINNPTLLTMHIKGSQCGPGRAQGHTLICSWILIHVSGDRVEIHPFVSLQVHLLDHRSEKDNISLYKHTEPNSEKNVLNKYGPIDNDGTERQTGKYDCYQGWTQLP